MPNAFDQIDLDDISQPPRPPLNRPQQWESAPTAQVEMPRPPAPSTKRHRPKLPQVTIPARVREAVVQLLCGVGAVAVLNMVWPEAAQHLSLLNVAGLLGSTYIVLRYWRLPTDWLVVAAIAALILAHWGM